MDKKRILKWLPFISGGLLIGLGLGLAIVYGFGLAEVPAIRGSDAPDSAKVGALAPDFELESLSGEYIRLSDLKGKPVLVNFWATWCAPCVLEMPNFQEYYEKYPGAFEVLAVNFDEPHDTVSKFVKDVGVTFPILFDTDAKVHGVYRFPGYPTTYVIDSDGVVRFQHVGLMDESTLEKYLTEVEAIP